MGEGDDPGAWARDSTEAALTEDVFATILLQFEPEHGRLHGPTWSVCRFWAR